MHFVQRGISMNFLRPVRETPEYSYFEFVKPDTLTQYLKINKRSSKIIYISRQEIYPSGKISSDFEEKLAKMLEGLRI